MNTLRHLIEEYVWPETIGPNGYSIFQFNENNFDVYLPTYDIEKYYFFSSKNGEFYDLFENAIQLSEIKNLEYETTNLINRNFKKVSQIINIYIEEQERSTYRNYKTPKETFAYRHIENGDLALESGRFSEAYSHYNKAVLLEQFQNTHYISRSNSLIKNKFYDEAIIDLFKAAIAKPVNKQNIFTFVFEAIAAIYSLTNKLEQAIIIYSFIYENEKKSWILQKRANCYKELQKYELAIEDYNILLGTERKIEILIEYAELFITSGNMNEAAILLNEIINFKPVTQELWALELLNSRNKVYIDKAKKLLQQL